MKTLKIIALALLVSLISVSCKKNDSKIVLKNDTSLDRVDEPVIITRAHLEQYIGEIPLGLVPKLATEDGDVFPSQVDDMDGDGQWDELFLLANLAPNSSSSLMISLVKPNQLPNYTQRSNVWLGKPIEKSPSQELIKADRPKISRENYSETKKYFQFEGPGWENDRVGFRNYFDERNGIDIFGKRTESMVLQDVGINEDYHTLHDWGMDILKVGESLGAGSLAIEKNGKLYRVAPESDGSYELLSNGPLRSIFHLTFNSWKVENDTCSVLHEITIYGGAWYYVSKVTVDGLSGDANLVTGITTIDLEEREAFFTDFENGIVAVSTHGQQSIEGEYLGMAVLLKKEDYKDFEYLDEKAEDINHTFMIRMGLNNMPISFRFYSAWELSDEKFAEKGKFDELLKNDALRMSSPIQVEIE